MLSRGIGLRLLFQHFATVLERERRASRSYRKRVTFVTLRSALEPELDRLPMSAEGLADPPPPPFFPDQFQSPTVASPNTERANALLQVSQTQSQNEDDEVILVCDSGVELCSSDSRFPTSFQASPNGASSLLQFKGSTAERVPGDTKESLSRVSVASFESSRTQSTTRFWRRHAVGHGDHSTSSSNASHCVAVCPPAAASLTSRRLGSLDTRAPPGSGALSVVSLLARAGLTLPNSELDTPTRRWVRSVRIAGQRHSHSSSASSITGAVVTGGHFAVSWGCDAELGKEGEHAIDEMDVECVPNLWNRCSPPPGLLVVPDAHLPPF